MKIVCFVHCGLQYKKQDKGDEVSSCKVVKTFGTQFHSISASDVCGKS